MKKKFLLSLLALVCALSCVFGLVACGDKNGGKELSADEFSSKTQTAMQSGFTFSFSYPSDNGIYSNGVCVSDIANERYFVTYPGDGNNTEKYIYAKEGANYYRYTAVEITANETYWEKSSYPKADFDNLVSTYGIASVESSYVSAFLYSTITERYNSFEFDKDSKVYRARNVSIEGTGSATSVEVIFKDGALVSMKVEGFADTQSDAKVNFTCTEFGSSGGELPADEYIVAPKMSHTEWSACCERFAEIDNLTLRAENNIIAESYVAVERMQLDGDTLYRINKDSNNWLYGNVYGKDEENYFKWSALGSRKGNVENFLEEDPLFKKVSIKENEYTNAVGALKNSLSTVAGVLSDRFDSFTYKNNTYRGDNTVVVEIGGFTLKSVWVTVVNGEIVQIGGWSDGKRVIVDNFGTTKIEYNAIPDTFFGHTFEWDYMAGYTITIAEDGKVTGTYEIAGSDGVWKPLNEFVGEKAFVVTEKEEYGNKYWVMRAVDGSVEYDLHYSAANGTLEISGYAMFKWRPEK